MWNEIMAYPNFQFKKILYDAYFKDSFFVDND